MIEVTKPSSLLEGLSEVDSGQKITNIRSATLYHETNAPGIATLMLDTDLGLVSLVLPQLDLLDLGRGIVNQMEPPFEERLLSVLRAMKGRG